MGSGAFLVAACRYLASSYEAALVREGGLTAADISESERADFRRVVAQRCLYGVDVNPMAVQLARLSLWLATLAADKPLTFLDHRLRVGNSLIGASLDDLRRAPRLRSGGPRRPAGRLAPARVSCRSSRRAICSSRCAPRWACGRRSRRCRTTVSNRCARRSGTWRRSSVRVERSKGGERRPISGARHTWTRSSPKQGCSRPCAITS